MIKQKKSFLSKIVGATERDLEDNVNLEQELKEQAEENVDEKNGEKEQATQELDDVSKEQIKKDLTEIDEEEGAEVKKEIKKEDKEKWLDDTNSPQGGNGEEGQLAIDVYQTEKDIVIKSIVGGVKSDEVDVSVNNDMVSIKGIRRNPDEVAPEDYYYQECFWGGFSRSVILPTEVEVENVEAIMKDGILTVKLPKLKKTVSKKIKVEAI